MLSNHNGICLLFFLEAGNPVFFLCANTHDTDSTCGCSCVFGCQVVPLSVWGFLLLQLMSTDNYKLLHQLYLMDGDILSVRILYAPAANNNIMEVGMNETSLCIWLLVA